MTDYTAAALLSLPDDIKTDVAIEYMELFRALEMEPFELHGPWLAMPTFERFAEWYFG